MTQQPRLIAGRYAVVEELGRGGMGVVWLAEDQTIGRRVAIKELVLPFGIAPEERFVFEERVLREARTAGRLKDPAIVTVYDVLQREGTTFIVMELIEAPNLVRIVERDGPLAPEQVLDIAEQLLSALQTAHAAGVVHRDVKPSNVMVEPGGSVTLTDFGIAHTTEDPRLTQNGLLMGSPTYISPERLRGDEGDPASDLWALGATLFFAAEGRGAYDRPTAAASIQAIMNEPVEVSGPLAELLTGLLDQNPATRLTIEQAREAIKRARQTEPKTATLTSALWRIPTNTRLLPLPKTKSSRRLGLFIALPLVFLAAVFATLAWSGVFSAKDNNNHTPVAAAPPPPNPLQKVRTFGPNGDFAAEEFSKESGTGHCYNGADFGDPVEDCGHEHDAEVFDEVVLDADDYPPLDQLANDAEAACVAKFREVTLPDKDKVLRYGAVVPTEAAWASSRRVTLCVVTKADGGKLTGSILGD